MFTQCPETTTADDMCKVVPIPEAIIASPSFRKCVEIMLLYDSVGGLPLPLPHSAVQEVLALVSEFRNDDGTIVPVVEQWQFAVLGLPMNKRPSLPRSPPVDYFKDPNESNAKAEEVNVLEETTVTMAAVQCAPEVEPASENHGILPRSPASGSPVMLPVQCNPEIDPEREEVSTSTAGARMEPVVYAPETEPPSENHELFPRSPASGSPRMLPVQCNPEIDPQREQEPPAARFEPVVYAPEVEPASENHDIFPRSPASGSPRMLPVQCNPEIDPERESTPVAEAPRTSCGGGGSHAPPRSPPSKRSSPLASPPLVFEESEDVVEGNLDAVAHKVEELSIA